MSSPDLRLANAVRDYLARLDVAREYRPKRYDTPAAVVAADRRFLNEQVQQAEQELRRLTS